ncbi:cytochrome c [Elizabethkingia anophelis]|uniref:cytochrome c n=1 Tax=Elizabethkingia anophelis TaxID=1117645 RepID=UPI001626507C|nr:cbb3-type cytochrome c oxidase N-terminal domain-containing protein [Elizabethkingia anophelis]MCT4322213.1 c-type cytochrome [Elizabethkingia anophelis]HAY3534498.1 c-type cytochrome [Elizabethkingia anophelis]HAY3546614.1 c-type cytochrome [Elizabethkingia anophelis]HAY3591402.1 c-type cytochrome [Elizabethkingia anophelis]
MKVRTPISVYIVLTVCMIALAFEMFAPEVHYLTSPYFWVVVIMSALLLLIVSSLQDLVENENFKKLTDEEKRVYLEQKKIPFLRRLWNSAVKKQSQKEETDLIIDHGFDGITELDNALPKWWIGLFYFGNIFCVIYMLAYVFTDYAHQDAEYEKEHKTMLASIEEYEKTAPKITLETAKYDPSNIAEGEQLFKTNCVTCHSEGGKGGIGPNLTDNHWINVKEKDVFHNVFWMLENGSPNNPTMRPFIKDGTISGRDAEKIAAYVYHINQETPPVKVEQGGASPQGEEVTWEK